MIEPSVNGKCLVGGISCCHKEKDEKYLHFSSNQILNKEGHEKIARVRPSPSEACDRIVTNGSAIRNWIIAVCWDRLPASERDLKVPVYERKRD
ncbi:hypothetical protein ACLOJK_034479 [Asimina triloba]